MPPSSSSALAGSIRPGPSSTVAQPSARSSTVPAPDGAISPESVSDSGQTIASGTATERAAATLAAVATCSLPAPDRSNASAASRTLPGVLFVPPTTRVRPRDSLPPPGAGRGHSRSAAAVTSWGSEGMVGLLAGVHGLTGRRGHAVLDSGGIGVRLQLQRPLRPTQVGRHRAVRHRRPRVQVEDLALPEPLEHETETHDHRLMAEDPDPFAVVAVRHVTQQAADPQRHIAPALARWRPVVELPEVAATVGLVRELGPDAVTGEAVEDAQLPLTQALVEPDLEPPVHRGQGVGGRRGRALVRRGEHDGRLLVGRQRRHEAAHGGSLLLSGRGQGDVRVADMEVEPYFAAGPCVAVRDVAEALCVPDQDEPARARAWACCGHGGLLDVVDGSGVPEPVEPKPAALLGRARAGVPRRRRSGWVARPLPACRRTARKC